MPGYDVALLMKVAEMYFFQKLSQKEISRILGLSTSSVSRLIKEGFDSNIIKVQISNIAQSHNELCEEIQKKYGIDEIVISDFSPTTDSHMMKKYLGQTAKNLFISLAKPGYLIGVGVGETISEMASSFNHGDIPFNLNVASLIGDWNNSSLESESHNILNKISNSIDCSCHAILSPVILQSSKTKELMMEEPEIKKVTDMWSNLDMVVFGIGPGIREMAYGENYIGDLSDVTGDLLAWALKKDGSVADIELNERLMSINPETLKKTPIRICVGGGKPKYANLISALKGGFITHLVTDYETAKYISIGE